MTNTQSKIDVLVKKKETVANIAVLTLSAKDNSSLPTFSAGAHVEVYLDEGLVRPYSLSNSPSNSKEYRIAVLREPESRGGSKMVYEQISEGDTVSISEPKNLFALSDRSEKGVLVAGGIGVTPILSMAYALRDAGRPFEIHYCFSTADSVAFIDELETEFPDQLKLHCSAKKKFDPQQVFANSPKGADLYVCGPEGFMTWVMDGAKSQGFAEENIHFEQFGAEVDVAGETFEVYCSSSDKTIQVGAEESIASALINAGVQVDVSCEQGICGTCITDVLEGTPDHRDQFLTDAEKDDNDQIALCCSRAKTPRLVVDI